MFDTTGPAFFDALAKAAGAMFDPDHPCVAALRNAAEKSDQETTAAAQDALRALAPETLEALMAAAHKLLRENPQAILAAWQPPHSRH